MHKLSKRTTYSKSKKWIDVSEEEMKIFIGILLLQSVVSLPEQEWYWSKPPAILYRKYENPPAAGGLSVFTQQC